MYMGHERSYPGIENQGQGQVLGLLDVKDGDV